MSKKIDLFVLCCKRCLKAMARFCYILMGILIKEKLRMGRGMVLGNKLHEMVPITKDILLMEKLLEDVRLKQNMEQNL